MYDNHVQFLLPCSLQETYEQRRAEHVKELERIENEMRQNFVNKVREKDLELKKSEKEITAKYEALRKENNEEKKRLDDERKKIVSYCPIILSLVL